MPPYRTLSGPAANPSYRRDDADVDRMIGSGRPASKDSMGARLADPPALSGIETPNPAENLVTTRRTAELRLARKSSAHPTLVARLP
jgi:hypothetical protein